MSKQNSSFLSDFISALNDLETIDKKQTKAPENLESLIKSVSSLLGTDRVKITPIDKTTDLSQLIDDLLNPKGNEDEKVKSAEEQYKTSSKPSTTNTSNTSTSSNSFSSTSIDLDYLIDLFLDNINSTIKHRKTGNKYVLLSLTNIDSTDQDKFPTSGVYLDLKNKTVWSRPIVDMYNKFLVVG